MEHKPEPQCSDHPDAPHGFNRSASHSEGRYVCDCEGWEELRRYDELERRTPSTKEQA